MTERGAAGMRGEGLVTFDDVAVRFSEEEWRGLQTQQKDLYREVMTDNYHNLTSLGLTVSPPEIVVKIEKANEEPSDGAVGDRMVNGEAGGLWGNKRPGSCEEGEGPSFRPAGGVITRRSLRLVKRNSGQWTEERRSKPNAKTTEKTAADPLGPAPTQDWSLLRTTLHHGAGPPSPGLRNCGTKTPRRAEDPAAPAPLEKPDPEEKLHTCGQCGESWSRLIDFLTHQMGNCQDRPHRCNICSKTFAKKQHLNAHQRTHTEDRPYTCHQCGRSFRQNSTLTTHLWSHAGHKPFHCSCCPKSFSRKTDLVAHMRRHTGERPYECPYCWDRFIRKKSLQRHLQKHSGESLRSGWEVDYPRWKQSPSFMERNLKMEEMPTEERSTHRTPEPTPEMLLRWDSERMVEPPPYREPPPPPPRQEPVPIAQPIKTEEEDEEPRPEAITTMEQSTQTESKRPSRLQQEMLRELKRFRRSTAHAQRERDLMRSAMDQMAQEMKELKEMVASLCPPSSGHYRPSPRPSAILVQNSCPVWSRPPEDRHSTESSRASPESSLQCGYGYPLEALAEQNREQSWMYENPPEDDMLPTTTIKQEEEDEEEEECKLSPEAGYYDSCRIGDRLPNIPMQPLSAEEEWSLLARSAGKPGRFAALVFRAVVPFDIYKSWVNRVNLDGLRGRQGIPLNVKRRVMGVVERHFNLRKFDHSEIRNRLNEQLRTRRKSVKLPQCEPPEIQLLNR